MTPMLVAFEVSPVVTALGYAIGAVFLVACGVLMWAVWLSREVIVDSSERE